MLRLTIAFCVLALGWANDCQLSNIKVKENFDKYKVSKVSSFFVSYKSVRTSCVLMKELFVRASLFCDHSPLCFLQFAGTWYAVAKKDPSGLFLLDNVAATYTVDADGKMAATAYGRVIIMKLVPNIFQSFKLHYLHF